MKKTKKLIVGLVVLLALGILTACGASDSDNENLVKLGINGDETEIWDYIKEELAKEDVELEIVSFSDFTRPNLALDEGEIQVNAFQHYAFLDKFKEEHNLDLTAIGETVSAPIGLYSSKIESLDELKEGDKLAIPNDGTNGGRVLILLQSAGLIELDPSAGNLPTIKDITANPKKLDIIEVDAGTSARMLEDVELASINAVFAVDAGFDPRKDALYLEGLDETTQPYINVIVVKTEDKDDPVYNRIVEIYRTDEVKEIIDRIYQGAQIATW